MTPASLLAAAALLGAGVSPGPGDPLEGCEELQSTMSIITLACPGDLVVYVGKIEQETGEWQDVWVSDMRGQVIPRCHFPMQAVEYPFCLSRAGSVSRAGAIKGGEKPPSTPDCRRVRQA